MRVAILIDAAAETADAATPDVKDALVQVEAVAGALAALGHESLVLGCGPNLDSLGRGLREARADVVFNLVESLDGHGRLIHLPLFCLDAWGIPYTGAPAEAMLLTSHKILAKERLRALGLPTPEWVGPFPGPGDPDPGQAHRPAPTILVDTASHEEIENRWIVKSVWEHASIGLDDGAVVRVASNRELWPVLRDRADHLGGTCFAERFVEGREFNLALLPGPDGPEVLPSAEIVFEGYGPDRLRIVDYRAKWDDDSYEYHHTPRRFDFPPEDATLVADLRRLALACWRGFGLAGYARVDFRVDEAGHPWILEINANPCLSPDAGFAAALERAGMDFRDAVHRILENAFRHHS